MPTAPPSLPRLLSSKETARALFVSEKTISNYRRAGYFPAGSVVEYPNGRVKFRADHVEAIVTGRLKLGPPVSAPAPPLLALVS